MMQTSKETSLDVLHVHVHVSILQVSLLYIRTYVAFILEMWRTGEGGNLEFGQQLAFGTLNL